MSPEEIFYFTTIILVGVSQLFRPLRNATAVAMVATWFVCRLLYSMTQPTPDEQLVMAVLSDCVVIAAMFVKEDWVTCPYQTRWHQLACLWLERTPWDKTILALFPVAWLFYFPILSPQSQYWTLYGIGLTQLALASREAYRQWQVTKANSSRADAPEEPPRSLFAPVRGEAYG